MAPVLQRLCGEMSVSAALWGDLASLVGIPARVELELGAF